jgi:hypothetical protein
LGLGDILGSISPAFGMASGKGMFGKLPLQQLGQSGVGGILGMLLSHGGQDHQAPVSLGASQPATLSASPVSLPGMSAHPSVGQALGSAMGGQGWVKPTGSGLSAGQSPPLQPQSDILQSVLADEGAPQAGPMSLSQILMRLGAMHR